MTDEERRLVIAEAIAAQHINREWTFSPDNTVPATARYYSVYDGAQIRGGGHWPSKVFSQIVETCKMPIVFYVGRVDYD